MCRSIHRFGVPGWWGVILLALACPITLSGCGSGGPPRYELSGSVTYGGQPIPAGSVTLIPDGTAGNSGPAASIQIENGAFDSHKQKTGHVGGPHVVRITALDGVVSDEFPNGVPLFPDYEIKVDLPKEDGTQNFDVPMEWIPQRKAPVVSHGA